MSAVPTTTIRVTGPTVAKGVDFTGCSDWAGPADACACETWEPAICTRCGGEIRDGQAICATEEVWTFDDEVEQTYRFHHDACPKPDTIVTRIEWRYIEEGETK